MGLQESQSRFYENMLGRSRAFSGVLLNLLQEQFDYFRDWSADELYEAVNIARPSLIRTEADELTYCLHIMVRYEMEKELFSNDFNINDLPEIWNKKMKEYLGIEPATDSEGILQDIHWSGGSFGYFPSYALGNAYAAQILQAMKRDIPVDRLIRSGDLSGIMTWLTEKIHKYGSLKTPAELIKDISGEELNADYFTAYLQEKFSALYHL